MIAQYPNIGTASWVKLVHTFKLRHGGYCDGLRLFQVIAHSIGYF